MFFVRGGEDDGRDVGRFGHREPVEPRHVDVEEEHVGRELARELERLDAVFGFARDLDAFHARQNAQDAGARDRLVVDDEDSHADTGMVTTAR